MGEPYRCLNRERKKDGFVTCSNCKESQYCDFRHDDDIRLYPSIFKKSTCRYTPSSIRNHLKVGDEVNAHFWTEVGTPAYNPDTNMSCNSCPGVLKDIGDPSLGWSPAERSVRLLTIDFGGGVVMDGLPLYSIVTEDKCNPNEVDEALEEARDNYVPETPSYDAFDYKYGIGWKTAPTGAYELEHRRRLALTKRLDRCERESSELN